MNVRFIALLLPALTWAQTGQMESFIVTGDKLATAEERQTGHVSLAGPALSGLAPGGSGDVFSALPVFAGAYEGFRGVGLLSLRGLNQDSLFAYIGTGSNALIAVLEDGAPLSNATLRNLPPLRWDLAGAEVMRGPQAVSHGPNSLGGALLLHRTLPEFSPQGQAFAEVSSFGGLKGGVVQNVVLRPRELALRLQLISEREDGQEINRFDQDERFAATSRDQMRVSGLWQPDADRGGKARIQLSLVRDRAGGNPLSTVAEPTRGDLFRRETTQNTRGAYPTERQAATLAATFLLPRALQVRSVASAQRLDVDSIADLDGTTRLGWFVRNRRQERRLTEDLALTHHSSHLQALIGAYAERSRYRVGYSGLGLAPLPAGSPFDNLVHETVDQLGLYTRGDAELVPHVRLSGGLRWTRERRSLDLTSTFGTMPRRSATASTEEESIQPQAALTWRPSPAGSLGLQFSRGARAGGTSYAPILGVLRNFAAEQGRDAELFARFRATDSFRLSAALFHSRLSNQQVPQPVPGGFPGFDTLLYNVAASRRHGVETEAAWRGRPHLTVNATMAMLRTEFRELVVGGRNRSGQAFPNAPRTSGSLGINYQPATGWFASARWSYATSTYAQINSPQVTALEPRRILSTQVGYAWKRVRLHAYGTNLLDAEYALYRSDNTSLGLPVTGKTAPGRTLGLRVELTW